MGGRADKEIMSSNWSLIYSLDIFSDTSNMKQTAPCWTVSMQASRFNKLRKLMKEKLYSPLLKLRSIT